MIGRKYFSANGMAEEYFPANHEASQELSYAQFLGSVREAIKWLHAPSNIIIKLQIYFEARNHYDYVPQYLRGRGFSTPTAHHPKRGSRPPPSFNQHVRNSEGEQTFGILSYSIQLNIPKGFGASELRSEAPRPLN